MFTSATNIVSVLVVLALFSQDGAARVTPRHRAGLQSQKMRQAVQLRSVQSDQSSLQLNPSQIGANLATNGQNPPVAGQVASLTSTNNYINFCQTQNVPLTNGTQIKTGSCNQTPMGRIIDTTHMPSCRFTSPPNGGAIKTNTSFTVKMTLSNLAAGTFTNAATTYYAAPQQVNGQGILVGHSHVVIEQISAFNTTTLTDPRKFAFFKGLDAAQDANGQLTADVTGGLPAGFYKVTSINTAANHQPALVAVAQHGMLDDASYFEVNDSGVPSVNVNAASASASSSTASVTASDSARTSAASTASASATSTAKGKGSGKAASTSSAARSSSSSSSAAGKGTKSASSTASAASSTATETASANGGKKGKSS